MDGKHTNKSVRVAITALGRCDCFAEHRDLVGCLSCIPSTASRAMSGTLKKACQLKVDAGFSFGYTTGHIRIAKL